MRLAGLVGITVTGLVHFFLLRPLLDLDGADWVADKLLHMVVPVLAVAAWAWVGPRPRVTWREAAYALRLAACAWLAWTLVVGQVDGWVPYPFLDADEEGWGSVAVVSVGITALFVAPLRALALARPEAATSPSLGSGHGVSIPRQQRTEDL